MLRKVYFLVRIAAYLLSLAGVFLYLGHRHDADTRLMGIGLELLMAGFICFFVSYGLRMWMSAKRRAARRERFQGVLRDPDPLDAGDRTDGKRP